MQNSKYSDLMNEVVRQMDVVGFGLDAVDVKLQFVTKELTYLKALTVVNFEAQLAEDKTQDDIGS
jgi:hypothetical protein